MTWDDVFKIMFSMLTSIGAGSAIVFALSSWLGKLWAQRILESERHELSSALEKTKRDLDVIKETTLRFQNDKIHTYRIIIDVVAKLLAALDAYELGRLQPQEANVYFDDFNEQRIRVYGYLAMIAPQAVMDAQDNLIDYLLLISQGSAKYEWQEVREKSLTLFNTIRVDIAIDKNTITYNGKL